MLQKLHRKRSARSRYEERRHPIGRVYRRQTVSEATENILLSTSSGDAIDLSVSQVSQGCATTMRSQASQTSSLLLLWSSKC
eukprot:2998583-Amphidinium_carterae.1